MIFAFDRRVKFVPHTRVNLREPLMRCRMD